MPANRAFISRYEIVITRATENSLTRVSPLPDILAAKHNLLAALLYECPSVTLRKLHAICMSNRLGDWAFEFEPVQCDPPGYSGVGSARALSFAAC